MMRLDDTGSVAAFHSTPMHDPGPRSSNIQLGPACAGVPVHYLISPVAVVGVEDRPPFGDLGCALRHRPVLVFRSHLVLSHCLLSWAGQLAHIYLLYTAMLLAKRPRRSRTSCFVPGEFWGL